MKVYKIGISDWAYLIATVFALFETLVYDKRNLSCWLKNRIVIPAGIVAIGAILSLFRSINPKIAIFEMAQVFYVITLFISLSWIMVRRGLLEKITDALIGSGFIAAAIALYDFLTHSQVGSLISGTPNNVHVVRLAGPFGHPNIFGGFLVLTSSLVIERFLRGNKKVKMKCVLTIIIMLFGLYISGSNTVFAAELMMMAVIFLFVDKKSRRKMIGFFLGILCLVLILLMLVGSINVINVFIDNIERNIARALDITIDIRLATYKAAIDEINKNPLIGVGYDQLPTSGLQKTSRLLPASIHNTILATYYAGGVFSILGWILIYLYIAYSVIIVCINQKKNESIAYIGIAAGVSSTFLMMQTQTSLYRRDWWLMIGLLLAVYLEMGRDQHLNSIANSRNSDQGLLEI